MTVSSFFFLGGLILISSGGLVVAYIGVLSLIRLLRKESIFNSLRGLFGLGTSYPGLIIM